MLFSKKLDHCSIVTTFFGLHDFTQYKRCNRRQRFVLNTIIWKQKCYSSK